MKPDLEYMAAMKPATSDDASASPNADRQELELAVARASTSILAIDAEGTVLAISRPAQALLNCGIQQAFGQPAAVYLPLLNATPLHDVGYSRRAMAVRADGVLLRQVISAIRMVVTDFDGWLVVMRADEAY